MADERARNPLDSAALWIYILVVCVAAGTWLPAGSADAARPDRLPPIAGLEVAPPGTPCHAAGYSVSVAGRDLCTHGPDPVPMGSEVAAGYRTTEELQASAQALSGPDPKCMGTGSDGNRFQAIYARPAEYPDRYEAIAPLVRLYASATVDAILSNSSAGQRQARWVTDTGTAGCQVEVIEIVLSNAGDNTFASMVEELMAKGYDAFDRKYVVWMDGNPVSENYCGMGSYSKDESPSRINANNGHPGLSGSFARIELMCWGGSDPEWGPTEAHEVVHTLGAVGDGAPNSTVQGHCTDDHDLMCYTDFSGLPMQNVCTETTSERLLDCNDNDYFAMSPQSAYLQNHWNTADSSFLSGTGKHCTHEGTDAGETIAGSSGNDIICAYGGNDVIKPGGGKDWVIAGPGTDTLDLSGSAAAAQVRFEVVDQEGNWYPSRVAEMGTATVDFHSIEAVKGTSKSDSLIGGRANEILRGGGARDFIFGGPGADKLFGDGGPDYIDGEEGSDTVAGGGGNDTVGGSAGTNAVNGGAGEDQLAYQNTNQSVLIDVAKRKATGIGTETFTSIELFFGSTLADVLKGSGGDDLLFGAGGPDEIYGYGGADTLYGDPGNDKIYAGGGYDYINGGEGSDLCSVGSGGAYTLECP